MGVWTNNPEGFGAGVQTIAMGGVAHALVLEVATSDSQSTMVSRNVLVDPGGASASLTLPAATKVSGGPFHILHTGSGGVTITLLEGGVGRGVLEDGEGASFFSNGVRLYAGMVGAAT